MVHGMAEQSGGKLILKSKLGEGTTVELCLPLADNGGTNPAEHAETPEAPTTPRLEIVSVDDDPLVAFNTCAMLEDLGHKVHCASSGDAALKLLRQHQVDLLITDQAMPGMTGIALAEAARAEWPDLPIIIATGYAELPDGAGKDLQRLAKPFFQQDLANAIAEITLKR
jgi:CheY-like chemotaxis protein